MDFKTRRKALSFIGSMAAFTSLPKIALSADTWPLKPLRIILAVPPGGPADAVCRLIAQQMQVRLKQPVVVENRPGAVGLVALQAAAAAPPDGYTLVQVHPGMIGAQLLTNRFDMVKDLSPISVVSDFQMALVVSKKLNVSTFQGFKELLNKNTAELTYGTLGVGSIEHLLIENFLNVTGVKALHVPYKGGAELVQAMLSGQIDFAYLIPQLAYPYISKDQMTALALLSDMRNKLLNDVPTLAELGVNVKPVQYWIGICAMSGVPDHISSLLHQVVVECVKDKTVNDYIVKNGSVARYSDSRNSFKNQMIEDQAYLKKIIDTNKIKAV